MAKTMETVSDMQMSRERVIVRTSIIGIVANVFLAAFKAAVGLISNSIAVTLDAVNNLSDALSSVITVVGTKLAARKPDKSHPLGYGRIEYLSAMIVAAIVLYAGLTSLVESVKKIIHPEVADYSMVSLVIIASAVVVKLVLGRYVRGVGERVKSGSLVASGSDALFDAILSASVLASAIVFLATGLSLEAYVGVAISVVIVKSGIEMMGETLDEILGSRPDREQVSAIKKTICEDENVHGAFDLILHSYGPEYLLGSVHVEVDDTLNAEDIDVMSRRITRRVYERHGVILTGVGIYATNTTNEEIVAMRKRIKRIVLEHNGALQTHGFHVDMDKRVINMDVILDFDLKDREELFAHIQNDVREAYPDFKVCLALDIDIDV